MPRPAQPAARPERHPGAARPRAPPAAPAPGASHGGTPTVSTILNIVGDTTTNIVGDTATNIVGDTAQNIDGHALAPALGRVARHDKRCVGPCADRGSSLQALDSRAPWAPPVIHLGVQGPSDSVWNTSRSPGPLRLRLEYISESRAPRRGPRTPSVIHLGARCPPVNRKRDEHGIHCAESGRWTPCLESRALGLRL